MSMDEISRELELENFDNKVCEEKHVGQTNPPTVNEGNRDAAYEVVPTQDKFVGNSGFTIKTKLSFNIEPFPSEIVRRLSTSRSFRSVEKDGELIVPLTCIFRCIWEGAQ